MQNEYCNDATEVLWVCKWSVVLVQADCWLYANKKMQW